MPWAWEYAPAGFRMTIEGGNINCGRLLGLAYNTPWPAIWNAYPILDVNVVQYILPVIATFTPISRMTPLNGTIHVIPGSSERVFGSAAVTQDTARTGVSSTSAIQVRLLSRGFG